MNGISEIVDSIPSKEHLWISITGGGGKTTLMQQLACEYKKRGKTVLITTTTKIQSPVNYRWATDYVFTDEKKALGFTPESSCVVLYADVYSDSKKLQSPKLDVLEKLSHIYDVVVCEADGSRHLPVKIHTDRDPVTVAWNDFTISIMGGWAFEKKLSDVCFGLETVDRISSGLKSYCVDEGFFKWYLDSPQGLLKGSSLNKRAVVVTGICPENYSVFVSSLCSERKIPVFFKDELSVL